MAEAEAEPEIEFVETESEGATGTTSPGVGSAIGTKMLVVKEVAPPWDPLSSDWNKESYGKDALLRIKR
jgi:hypothetical protein